MPFNLLRLGTLIALAHTLGLIAAFHAIRTARTSQGAVAWAVSLITIHYLTLVPYLFVEQPLCRLCGPAALCPAENAQTRLAARKPPSIGNGAQSCRHAFRRARRI